VEIAGEEIIPWTAWTPTCTVNGGTVDSITIVYARYRKQHKTCFYEISCLVNPNAGNTSGTAGVRYTTPITPSRDAAAGNGYGTTDSHMLNCRVNASGGYIEVSRVNSGSPIRDPNNTTNSATYIVISGFYEVA
jgi:hypothetical protein